MKKITSFILILSLVFTFAISSSPAYADGNDLLNSLNEGLTNILENGVDSLKTVLTMIDDLIKYTVENFSDLKESDWFIKTVSKLVGMGGIDGYTDGTFKPNKEMTKGEFTKLLISTLGYEEENATDEHWSMNYIRRAEKLNILDKGEFEEEILNNSITRYEMAKMIVRAIDEEYPNNIDKYVSQIKDYNNIPTEYKEYVLKAYVKGIITGYEDGEFKGNQGLTRAEASTVIVRIIDETERKVPELEEVEEPEVAETIEGDFFKFENDILYYIDNDGNAIDTMTNSTYMTREEINWYFKTMYNFAEENDLYFTIRYDEELSSPDFIAAYSKENLEDLNKSAYISITFTNNGNIKGMDQIGKNISIETNNLTEKAPYLNKVDVKPYLKVAKKVIKHFTGDKYTEQLYTDFETFQKNKSYDDVDNSKYYGPIKTKFYTVNGFDVRLGSAGGYRVRYDLH